MIKSTKINEMKRYLFILLMIILNGVLVAQEGNNNAIVLELFTSQGCSSCPPADELLDTIKKEYASKNVFVLSYHVDYWNRLGWKDPFSSDSFTEYQREYAQHFLSRSIYTPQLVVNGSEHFTGSNGARVQSSLRRYSSSTSTNSITINSIKKEEKSIFLKYNVTGDPFERVTLALIVSERITKISKGENRNRTIKNSNIVANQIIETVRSGSVTINIPDWIQTEDELSVIAYTQDKDLKITDAAMVTL